MKSFSSVNKQYEVNSSAPSVRKRQTVCSLQLLNEQDETFHIKSIRSECNFCRVRESCVVKQRGNDVYKC